MKLLVIFACLALLCGVSSSETPDVDDRATVDDALEEPATVMESNDLDSDDDDTLAASTAVDEWDEEAAMDWAEGQGDEEWDEAHTLAWMSAEQAQVSYALDSGIGALTEGRLGCSCSRSRRDCRCCFKFKILWKKYKACLVAYYRTGGKVAVKATLNSRTIVSRCAGATRTKVMACRRFLRKRVCVGLSGIQRRSHDISARGKFQVKGIVTKRTRRFTIRF